ncbi:MULTISPECIES: glycoside hydrolase family protein [Niastella]|uniref:Glycosyl hydrolase family 32 N-terminal domain-containing protein n=1 Tax=Niastella soli TaxID=2821487 RepID=A0ABS3YRD5_9BACT|nr:hypothetical protein [Niastella soli]MBO9200142.1 hypothetical protein [Niastella soli]
MNWNKKGLIFIPDGSIEWSQSHAQVPVVDHMDETTWRIYYATRDANSRSHISFIEVEAGKPEQIKFINDRPLLSLGRLGTFDEDGVMPSSIITVNNRKLLYYIGWSQRKNVPYQNTIGLAISDDGGNTFQKYSEGPIIGVNHLDPFFTGTIFVFKDGDLFKGYYLSCVEWKLVNSKPESTYVLKYATSKDGINWDRDNIVAIPFKDENEGGLVSASVIKLNGKYLMWFGYRNYFDFRTNPANSYRIGFAESVDGINWIRKDQQSGIDISETGWDSEMISYPYVTEFKGEFYLFYNGNQFGKTGFGYATLKP